MNTRLEITLGGGTVIYLQCENEEFVDQVIRAFDRHQAGDSLEVNGKENGVPWPISVTFEVANLTKIRIVRDETILFAPIGDRK